MPDSPTARTLATYQAVAGTYRDRHDDRSVVADVLDRFEGALPERGRVLDVGCGPGWESATLAERGHDVVAVDLVPAFLRATGEVAPGADRLRMDMRSLAFDDGAFDGLWVCASFLHVPRRDALSTLRGFERVLTGGGALSCAVKRGDGERTGDVYASDGRHFTLYDAGSLRSLAVDAGLRVDSLERSDDEGDWLQLFARAGGGANDFGDEPD
jgi:SAM-dependent methyltransferase